MNSSSESSSTRHNAAETLNALGDERAHAELELERAGDERVDALGRRRRVTGSIVIVVPRASLL